MVRGVSDTKDSWAVLAALRFFLASTVMLGHFSLYIRFDHTGTFGAGLLNPLSAVFGFFILSGYSIAASLDRESSNYYLRRVARIWPMYLFCIISSLVMFVVFFPRGFAWPLLQTVSPPATGIQIIASLLMLQTIVAGPIPIAGVTWSLAAEWWHYMVAPLLKRAPSALLAVLMLLSFGVYIAINRPDSGDLNHGVGIVALSWFWVTGFLYYRHRGTPIGFALLVFPSILAFFLGRFVGFPLFIATTVLVLSAEFRLSARVRRVFNYCGEVSFPLYLFHMQVFVALLSLGVRRSIIILLGPPLFSAATLYFVDHPSRAALISWFGDSGRRKTYPGRPVPGAATE